LGGAENQSLKQLLDEFIGPPAVWNFRRQPPSAPLPAEHQAGESRIGQRISGTALGGASNFFSSSDDVEFLSDYLMMVAQGYQESLRLL